jgi:hypothetical protein
LSPERQALKVLAGEGNFHLYRLLNSGQRVFVFAKCLLTTLNYFRGHCKPSQARNVSFVKGTNQLRYHEYARVQLELEFGAIELFASSSLANVTNSFLLPRIRVSELLQQLGFLALMLLSGKKRYLNLYLLAFTAAIRRVVDSGFPRVETFVCYNDQPYDVAAILFSLNDRNHCRTIVIQHGLILNEKFYFPSVAKEFWAWGNLSKKHYRAWSRLSQIVVKGRYSDDAANKQDRFVLPPAGAKIRILVAPSFFHEEVKQIVTALSLALRNNPQDSEFIAIKFHPATKNLREIKAWCNKTIPWLAEETAPMEALAERYDVLITKNSTSAIDFLLRGKPVFFIDHLGNHEFPSKAYCFSVEQQGFILRERNLPTDAMNSARKDFLKAAIDV